MAWRTTVAAIVAVAASLLSFSPQAQTLYVATGSGGVAGNLYTVDPTTAAATVVGPILVGALPVAITALAFHPTTGVLYAVTSSNSPNLLRHLITINPATGAATDIGALGVGIGGADMAFDAAGTLYSTSGTSTSLYTINLATGAATLVGATGVGNVGTGFAINSGGTAFMAGNGASGALSTVNLATGAATPGPALNGAPIPGGAIDAMKFDGAGVLFAVNNTSPGPVNNLVTINTATGTVTNIGVLPANIDGLAFGVALAASAPLTLPTLGQWTLIALALMLGAVGVVAVGRRGR